MAAEMTRRRLWWLVVAGSAVVSGLAVLPALSSNAANAVASEHMPLVQVRLGAQLAQRATSRKERLSVAFHPGMTPGTIAEEQGFRGYDLYSIMAVVNGRQADFITPLVAGDQVELMIPTAGG